MCRISCTHKFKGQNGLIRGISYFGGYVINGGPTCSRGKYCIWGNIANKRFKEKKHALSALNCLVFMLLSHRQSKGLSPYPYIDTHTHKRVHLRIVF